MIKTIKSLAAIAVFSCLVVNVSYGQLGGLKSKVKSKANKAIKKPKTKTTQSSNSSSSSTSSSSSSSKSSQGAGSKESPAKSAIYRFRGALKNGSNYVSRELETINGGSSSNKQYAEEKLDVCKTSIAEIKELDPSFAELPQFEKDYNQLQASFDKHMLSRVYYAAFKKSGSDFYSLSQKKIDRFPKDRHYKTMMSFDSLCAAMDKDKIDHSEVIAMRKDAINTRDQGKLDIVQNVMKITDYQMTYSKRVATESRQKEDYIEYFDMSDNNPDKYVKQIQEDLEVLKKIPTYYNNDTINNSIKSLESRVSDLQQYRTSGQYEADIKKNESHKLNLVRLPKPGSQNTSSNIAYIKNNWNSDWGSLKKVVISSNDWEIEKNYYDIPKHKELVGAATAKNGDGTCAKLYVYIVRTYTGGGTYAKKKFVLGSSTKMDCANLMK